MADGWIEAKKSNICPICGTGDYCAHKSADDGYGEVYLCKRYQMPRVSCPGSDTPGYDGHFYLLCQESSKGYGVYRRAEDVKQAEDNGYHIFVKGKDVNAVKGPGAIKKELIPVGINEIASDVVLDRFYRALIKKYPITGMHRQYLRKEGWSDELIENSELCSFPIDDWKRNASTEIFKSFQKFRSTVSSEIVKELGEPIGIPGFYQKKSKDGNEYWTINCRSGIGFPLKNEKGEIVRIRVRMDFLDSWKNYHKDTNGYSFIDEKGDGKLRYMIPWKGVFQKNFDGELIPEKEKKYNGTGKYRPLTSFSEKRCYEEGTYTNWYKNGTEASNICGLTATPNDNFLIAIATEGEKKGIIGNAAMHMPYIIIPGVNSFKKVFETRVGKNIIEKLRDNGTKYIAIAYDADKAKNINVLNAEKAFATEILNAGFGCIIVNWDPESGKGMDDAIINKSQFQFSEITKENIENYYCPWYANLEKG